MEAAAFFDKVFKATDLRLKLFSLACSDTASLARVAPVCKVRSALHTTRLCSCLVYRLFNACVRATFFESAPAHARVGGAAGAALARQFAVAEARVGVAPALEIGSFLLVLRLYRDGAEVWSGFGSPNFTLPRRRSFLGCSGPELAPITLQPASTGFKPLRDGFKQADFTASLLLHRPTNFGTAVAAIFIKKRPDVYALDDSGYFDPPEIEVARRYAEAGVEKRFRPWDDEGDLDAAPGDETLERLTTDNFQVVEEFSESLVLQEFFPVPVLRHSSLRFTSATNALPTLPIHIASGREYDWWMEPPAYMSALVSVDDRGGVTASLSVRLIDNRRDELMAGRLSTSPDAALLSKLLQPLYWAH